MTSERYTYIRNSVQRVFKVRACDWQIGISESVTERDGDVVSVAGTGSGKTLTFWIPVVLNEQGIMIVVTALNTLGKQMVDELERVNIRAISIDGKSASAANFAVSFFISLSVTERLTEKQAIAAFEYRVIMTSPEQLLKPKSEFLKLWKDNCFVNRVIAFVWDEVHTVDIWNPFRPLMESAGDIRLSIPRSIPFLATSATVTASTLNKVMTNLSMDPRKTKQHWRSNDRPNIALAVRPIDAGNNQSAGVYSDLLFLVQQGGEDKNEPPPKFVVFAESKNLTQQIGAYLQRAAPARKPGEMELIPWFHSGMSPVFLAKTIDDLKSGRIWGLVCTDAFGLVSFTVTRLAILIKWHGQGMDIPDIRVVVQWCVPSDLCTLWQRFGRAARDPKEEGLAVLFVESRYQDVSRIAKAHAAEKKRQKDEPRAEFEDGINELDGRATNSDTGIVLFNLRLKRYGGTEDDGSLVELAKKFKDAKGKLVIAAVTNDSVRGGSSFVDPMLLPNPADRYGVTDEGYRYCDYRYANEPVQASASEKKSKKAKKDEPPVFKASLEDYSNAAFRGFGCIRKVLMIFFKNNIDPKLPGSLSHNLLISLVCTLVAIHSFPWKMLHFHSRDLVDELRLIVF